ncbi:histidinol-phosphatase [Malassezia sp. CBS 17886]|nr:histidinol-phosphatase [Malassezia sp. CBS 17886]
MHSHHSHSGQYCMHAKSTLAEVVEQASLLGFTHYHLSEHVPRPRLEELYPEEAEAGVTPRSLADTFTAYLQEARRLQDAYATSERPMAVLVGCETENIVSPGTIDALITTLGAASGDRERLRPGARGPAHPCAANVPPPPCIGEGVVDYLVGSVHHVHGTPIDFDRATFQAALAGSDSGAARTALLHAYLDAQYEVLDRLRPEVIGHFDLFRLFAPDVPWFPPQDTVDGRATEEKLMRNIRFAASYGALFEANSAAFRKGWHGETYPGRYVLGLIKRAHGRVALSDDSHGVEQVGLNYARLRDYLLAEGVDEVWLLEADRARSAQPHIGAGRTQRDLDALWAQFRAGEDARAARVAHPTRDAPTAFPRGTRAVRMGDWQHAPFWERLPPSRGAPGA